MAYRKTAEIEAEIAGRKERIIAATIAVVARRGLEGLTTERVANRARVATGLPHKYFADKTELIASAVESLRARHMAALSGSMPLAGFLEAIYANNGTRHLNAMVTASPIYREAIREAVGAFLVSHMSLPPSDAKLLSVALLGLARGIHEETEGSDRGRVLFLRIGGTLIREHAATLTVA